MSIQKLVALRRDECKIRQDGRESLSLSWFQLFKAHESTKNLSMSHLRNSQNYMQQDLQPHDLDYSKVCQYKP